MKIRLTKAGKRFNRDWIFRNADIQFVSGESYAITGANGSGKSTLLQVLSGSMAASEGNVDWLLHEKSIDPELVFRNLTIAAPYVELIEEMTAIEFLKFHQRFKPLLPGISTNEIISIIGLEKAATKQIRYFSSGMKQRIKLAQAIFSDVPLLLLDEPCTNFDTSGYELYNHLIATYARNKTIVVSSNDMQEYSFCKHIISIIDFK